MKLRFAKIYLGIFLVVITFAANVYSEDQVVATGPVKFDGISSEREKIFIARIFDGKPLKVPADLQIFPGDDQLQDVWRGNRPQLSAKVDSLLMTFSRVVEGKNETERATLQVTAGPDELVFRHSTPFLNSESGGVRVPIGNTNKARRFLLRARGQSSFVIMVPKFASDEKDRGALVCPRDFLNEGARVDKASLRDLDLRLDDLSAQVQGEVHGQFSNQIDMVKVLAKISTTEGIIPSEPAEDESYSKKASAGLIYKPSQRRSTWVMHATDNNSIGIETSIEMHGPSEFKRISRLRSMFFVKPVVIESGFVLPVLATSLKGTPMESELSLRGIQLKDQAFINVNTSSGTCYLVLNHNGSIIHEYLKEPFKVPENFIAKE